jgi:uncharacterized UBP type Zn finger protein
MPVAANRLKSGGFDGYGVRSGGNSEEEEEHRELTVPQTRSGAPYDDDDDWDFAGDDPPGFAGLRNIGNTCYASAALQNLFMQPHIRREYASDQPAATACCGNHF